MRFVVGVICGWMIVTTLVPAYRKHRQRVRSQRMAAELTEAALLATSQMCRFEARLTAKRPDAEAQRLRHITDIGIRGLATAIAGPGRKT